MPRDRTPPRAGMIDAFNSARIDFGVPDTEPIDESTQLPGVIDELAARQEVRTTTKYVRAAQPNNQLVGACFSFRNSHDPSLSGTDVVFGGQQDL